MLRKLLFVIFTLPAAALMVAWAVANRQPVTVSFDPFDGDSPAYTLTLPLYVIGFAILVAGVIVGGVAAWLEQGKRRRERRRLAAEVEDLRSELDQAQQEVARQKRPSGSPRVGPVTRRLPAA